MSNRRVLALDLPHFQIERLVRQRPALRDAPLVVFEPHGPRQVVVAVSPAAHAAGVRCGRTVTQARARCPALDAWPAEPLACAQSLEEAAEALLQWSPQVEAVPPGLLWAEIGGTAALFGGENALVDSAIDCLDALGYTARAAVAPGPLLARALACFGATHGPVFHMDGFDALPLRALQPSPQALELLEWAGVRTVGQLRQLPRADVIRRLGPEGSRLHRLASGEDPRLVAAARPTRPLAERLELASACSELEPLSFGLKAVLQSLEVRMGGRGVGAHRLDLTLELAGKAPLTVELPLGRPLRSATALLTIAKEHLASIRLPAAVEAISVTVAEWAPWRGRQLDLLDRTEGAGEELDELLARLSAVLGKEAVFAARVERRHRPERAYETQAFDPPGHTRDLLSRRAAAAPVGGRRPTVLLPQPVPLAWTGDWVEAVVQGSALRRRASTVSQPERLVGEWWSEPFHRDYHVLSLQDGTRWWIFRDMISDVWFLHGVFE